MPNMIFVGQDFLEKKSFFSPTIGKNFILNATTNFLTILSLYLINKEPVKSVNNLLIATAITTLLSVKASSFFLKQRLNNYIDIQKKNIERDNKHFIDEKNLFLIKEQKNITDKLKNISDKKTRLTKFALDNWLNTEEITTLNLNLEITEELCTQKINLPFLEKHFDKIIIDNDRVTNHVNKIIADYLNDEKYSQEAKLELLYTIPLDFKLSKIVTVHLGNYFNSMIAPAKISAQYTILNEMYNKSIKNTLLKNNLLNSIRLFMQRFFIGIKFKIGYDPEAMLSYVKTILDLCDKNKANKEFETDIFFADPVKNIYKDYYEKHIVNIVQDNTSRIPSEISLAPLKTISNTVVNEKKYIAAVGCDEKVISSEINKRINQVIENIKNKLYQGHYDNIAWEDIFSISEQKDSNWIMKLYAPITALFLQRIYSVDCQNIDLHNIFNECDQCFNNIKKIKLENNNKANDIIVSLLEQIMNFTQLCKKFMQYYNTYTIDNKDLMGNKSDALKKCKENFLSNIINKFKDLLYTYSYEKKTTLLEQILMFYIQNTDNSDYENTIIKPLKTFDVETNPFFIDTAIPEKQSFPTHYSEELEECIRFYTRYNQLKYSAKNGNLSDYDIFAFINWIEASHLIQMYPQENYNKKIEEFKTNNNQFKTLFEMYKNKIDTNISENIKKKLATVMYGGPIDSGFYQEIIKRWMLYIEKSNQKNITEESKKHHSIFLNLLQYFKLNNDFHVKIKKNGPNNTIDHKDMFRFNIERYIAQNILQAQSEKDDVFKRMTILYNIISNKNNYSQKHTKNILYNIFHRNNKFFTLATNEDIEIIIKYLAVFYPKEKSLEDLKKMLIILKENSSIKNFISKIHESLDNTDKDLFLKCAIYVSTLNKFLSEQSTEAFIELIEALHNQKFYDPVKKDLHGHKIILTGLKFELINDIVMLGNEKKVFENESFQEYRDIFTINNNNNNVTLSNALLFYIYKKSIKDDHVLFEYLFPKYEIITMKNLQDVKDLLTYLSKLNIKIAQDNNEGTLNVFKKEYMMQDNSQDNNEDTLTVSKKEAKNNNSNNNNPDLEKQKNYLQLYVNLYDNTITVQKIFHNISDAFFNSMVKKNTIKEIIKTKILLNMKLDNENNTFYNILFKDLLNCGDKLLCLLLNSMVFDNYNTAMKFTNIYYHPPFSEYKTNVKPESIITSDEAFLLFSYIKKNDVSIFLKILNKTLQKNEEKNREKIIKELLCILKNNNIKEETNFTHNTDFDHKVLYPIKKHHIIIKDILKIYNNRQHGNSTYYKNAYAEEERNEIQNCIALLPKQKKTNNDVLPVNNKNDNNNEKKVVFYTKEIKKAHLANELRIIDKIIKFYLIADKESFKKHILFSKICHLLKEEEIKNNPRYSILQSIIDFQKDNIDKFGKIDHAKYLNDENVSLLCKTMVDLSEANYRVIVKLSLKKPLKRDMQKHITELKQHIEYFTNLKNNTNNISTKEMLNHINKYKEYHSLKNVILAFFYDTYFYAPAKSFFIAMTNKIKDQLIDINAFHEEEIKTINNEIDYAKHCLDKTEDSRNAFLFHLYLTNKILLNKILEYCKNNIDKNNTDIIEFYSENINTIYPYKLPYNIRKNIYYEPNRDNALTCTVLDNLSYDLHSFQNIKKDNSTGSSKNQWSKKNGREEKFIVEYNFSKNNNNNNNNISLLNTEKSQIINIFNNLSSEEYFVIKDPYLIRFDIKKISHHLTDSLLKNEDNNVTLVQLGLQKEDITNFFIDIFAESDPEKSFAPQRPTKNSYLHFANKITITKNLNEYKINIEFFNQTK